MNRSKIAFSVMLVALCIASVEVTRFFYKPPQPVQKIDARYLSRSKGSPRAKLWVVEYLDFQCTTCASARGVMERYLAGYPGKIFWQVRFFPLRPNDPGSVKSLLYAECAARQGKFWPFHDQLYEKQGLWAGAPDPEPALKDIAKDCGMDPAEAAVCAADPGLRNTVFKEKKEAMALGVRQAPTFFVNGKIVYDLQTLQNELDARLKAGAA